MRRSSLVVLLVSQAACAGQSVPPLRPVTEYVVGLDGSLRPEDAADVVAAIDSWRSALGSRATVRVVSVPLGTSGTCPGMYVTGWAVAVCVADGAYWNHQAPENPAGLVIGSEYKGQVWLQCDQMRAAGASVQTTAAHELGHAMGLVHTGWGTLMCPDYYGQATEPTQADLAQWEAVR